MTETQAIVEAIDAGFFNLCAVVAGMGFLRILLDYTANRVSTEEKD